MKKQLLLLLTIAFSIQSYATIIYVNPTATGNNDGSSWADAYTDLQIAFDNLTPGANDSVFVAEGTYKPSGTAAADALKILENCSVFGGFPATGNPGFSDRDWNTYVTNFDGDLNGDDIQNDLTQNKTDNSERILGAFAAAERITLDGIFFKNGGSNSSGSAPGIASSAFLHLYNCRFEDFRSTSFGVIRLAGAAGNADSSFFYNTHFFHNTSNSTVNGIVFAQHLGELIIENCTFNHTFGSLSEIYANGPTDVKLSNCVFANRLDGANNVSNTVASLTTNIGGTYQVNVEINHCTYYNVDQPFYCWASSKSYFTISNTYFDFSDAQNAFLFKDGTMNAFGGSPADTINIVLDSVACSNDSIINTTNDVINNTNIEGVLLTGAFDYATKDTVNNIYKLDCANEFVNRGFVISGISEDIEGNNRVIGCGPDLGAFESACPVNNTTTPAGDATQTFCEGAEVSELDVTGDNIQWYDAAAGGNMIAETETLTSGQYFATQTVNGCESTTPLEVDVTVNPMPNITIDSNIPELSSEENSPAASFQWLDCNANNAPIAGETSSSFTASENGDYAVEIDLNGCVDTSNCVAISSLSINELSKDQVSMYPNPVNNMLQIQCDFAIDEVTIYSATGRKVFHSQKNVKQINTEALETGVYFVQFTLNGHKTTKKLIKK